jgi:predicted HTH transcriptional regulator
MRDVPQPGRMQRLLGDLAGSHQQLPAPDISPGELASYALPAGDAAQLIAGGEGQFVEFKASLQWDYRQQRVNKELYEPVMKNLAAFMNSSGGYLLIGVSDDGEVLGLEADLRAMQKGNLDGFENKFNVAFNTMIGAEFRRFVQATFPQVNGVIICLLATKPANEPVYLHNKGEESFYIRAGNGSQPLSLSKAARYIQSHF